MRKLLIGLSVFAIVSCSKKSNENDVMLLDYGQGTKLELTGPLIVKSSPVDVNSDAMPDYFIELKKINKNGTTYHEDAFYITIKRSLSYLGRTNPFTPVLLNDTVAVYTVNSPVISKMAKLYSNRENISVDSTHTLFDELFLSKQDEIGAIKPSGDKYFPIVMGKGGDGYYGWMHFSFDDNSITIKATAFCTTPNKKISMGKRE